MARDFIKIDTSITTAIHSGTLKNAVQQVRQAYDRIVFLKQMMDHMTDGTSYADVELYFGLPTGQGQAVYNLVNNSMGAAAKNLTEQVG